MKKNMQYIGKLLRIINQRKGVLSNTYFQNSHQNHEGCFLQKDPTIYQKNHENDILMC